MIERCGARLGPNGTTFRAWAPEARSVSVVVDGREIPLEARADGIFDATVEGVGAGARYRFSVDGRSLPDPYARFMPDGVHGEAEVVASDQAWKHPQRPIALENAPVIYELHVGTFTPEGTYAAAAEKLDALVELGVSVVELMPVAAFPGARGWGYDGVGWLAPFAGYGRPEALKAFVDAAHGRGLSVMLDVVLNHFGPDGNYLGAWASSYFDSAVKTPWGDGPAFGHPRMRRLALDTVEQWLEEYRFDGLRLDATHEIQDPTLLADVALLAHALEPSRVVIAEDDRNDASLVTRTGMDGVWADDLHHVLHVLLTGERDGYYAAYSGTLEELAQTIRRGWLYEGQIYPTSQKPRGGSSDGVSHDRMVVGLQNHDQIGNRAMGERLGALADPRALRAATLTWLLLPTTPLLFMGQEWGASTPFLYFTDHSPELGEKVVEGRRKEFARFSQFADPSARERIPSPQDPQTAAQSTLRWDERDRPEHRAWLELFTRAIGLRRSDPALSRPRDAVLDVAVDGGVLTVRWKGGPTLVWNTGESEVACSGEVVLASEPVTAGRLPPRSAGVFR